MNPWSRFVAAVDATESATTLALFRIGIGLGVLYSVGSVVARGLVPVLWIDRDHGGMRDLMGGPFLVQWLGGPTPEVVWSLVAASLLGGLLLVLGVGGRWASLLALQATMAVVNLNNHAGGNYDELLVNALWLLVLGPGHQTLSLTARWSTGRFWPDAQVWAAPRWLAVWQLALMYWATGFQKASAHWVPGGEASALYYILQQPSWHRWDLSWVAWVYPLTQAATTVTWFWEVLAPLWLLAVWASAEPGRPGRLRAWSNRLRLRTVFAGLGLVMHLVIFVTMDVGPFSFLSLCFYVTTVHPWEWERELRRLGPA